ncbi:hypothetical protein Daus18300_010554, partial [Diaporthe australafricana]
MSTRRLAQAQAQAQRRKARNGPPSARDSRSLWLLWGLQQEEKTNPLVLLATADQWRQLVQQLCFRTSGT